MGQKGRTGTTARSSAESGNGHGRKKRGQLSYSSNNNKATDQESNSRGDSGKVEREVAPQKAKVKKLFEKMSKLDAIYEGERGGKEVIEGTDHQMKREDMTCMADQNLPGNDESVAKNEKVEKANTVVKKRKRGADREIVDSFLSSPTEASSRLRSRKPVPSFRKVTLNESDYSRIVGRRVKVYWPIPRRWFLGHVNSFDKVNKAHEIVYDDGDKEVLKLLEERFELEVMPDEVFGESIKYAPESAKKEISLEVGKIEKLDSGNLSTPEPDKKYGKSYKTTHKGSKKGRTKHKDKNDAEMEKLDKTVMDVEVYAVSENDEGMVISKGLGEKNPTSRDVRVAKELDVLPESDEGKVLSKGNGENIPASKDVGVVKELDVHESLSKLPVETDETSLGDKALLPESHTLFEKPEMLTEENQKVVESEVIGHKTKEHNLQESNTPEPEEVLNNDSMVLPSPADDYITKVKAQPELLSEKLDPSGESNVKTPYVQQTMGDETMKEISGGS